MEIDNYDAKEAEVEGKLSGLRSAHLIECYELIRRLGQVPTKAPEGIYGDEA